MLSVAPRRPMLNEVDRFPKFHRSPGAILIERRKRKPTAQIETSIALDFNPIYMSV
jgi:hypothetical protein